MTERLAATSPEEAMDRALLYVLQWSDKQHDAHALTAAAVIRALEQDGYTVAQGVRVGDPPPPVDDAGGLRKALEDISDSEPVTESWDGWREVTRLRDIARAALAAQPAPPPALPPADPTIISGTPENKAWHRRHDR